MPRSLLWPDPRVKPPFGAAEIDWGHRLAQGLLAAWLLNEGGGPTIDVTRGLAAAPVGGIAWTPGPGGMTATFSTTGGKYFAAPKPAYLQQATTSVVSRICNRGASNQTIASVNFNGSNVPWRLSLIGASSNGYAFYDGAWHNSGFVTDVTGDGLVHTIAGSYNGLTLRYYVDGTFDASFAYTGTQSLVNTNTFDIGRYGSAGFYFDGDIYHVFLYDHALSDEQMYWTSQEPYAFLRPILRRRYFVPAGANTAGPLVGYNILNKSLVGGKLVSA